MVELVVTITYGAQVLLYKWLGLDTPRKRDEMAVYFYSAKEKPYGGFSNFSAHGFELDGKYWPTSEHYFQAQKFAGTPYAEQTRLAKSPTIAARLGRSRKYPIRSDWEQVKDDIMRQAVRRKFDAHPDIRETLLATGDNPIIENAPGDYYWGCGKDGTGRNMLGIILMETRAALRG
jgi:N-glycosidase YbiA